MSTDAFAMEPQSTQAGLSSAGAERSGALAQGLPALHSGSYTAGYAAAVEAVLGAHHMTLSALTTKSTATAAASVAATESTEADSAATLST